MPNYREADEELLTLAQEIIARWHSHLQQARIGFVYQDTASTRKGRQILASVRLINAHLQAAGLPFDYLVTVAKDEWNQSDHERRVTILDHEFCHCAFDREKWVWTTRDHDIQEFREIVARHGLWTRDLRYLGQVLQERLPLEDEPVTGAVGAVSVDVLEAAINRDLARQGSELAEIVSVEVID